MIVERHGKTIIFSEEGKETTVRFTKSHDASNFRNEISLENNKTYNEVIGLIKKFNGKKI